MLYLVGGASGQCLQKDGSDMPGWMQMTLRMRNLKGWGGCGGGGGGGGELYVAKGILMSCVPLTCNVE